jgi:hypothetical protein
MLPDMVVKIAARRMAAIVRKTKECDDYEPSRHVRFVAGPVGLKAKRLMERPFEREPRHR